jgi:hypothetical protein
VVPVKEGFKARKIRYWRGLPSESVAKLARVGKVVTPVALLAGVVRVGALGGLLEPAVVVKEV